MPKGYYNSDRNLVTWVSDYLNIPSAVQEKIFTIIYVSLVIGLIVYYLYNKIRKD